MEKKRKQEKLEKGPKNFREGLKQTELKKKNRSETKKVPQRTPLREGILLERNSCPGMPGKKKRRVQILV